VETFVLQFLDPSLNVLADDLLRFRAVVRVNRTWWQLLHRNPPRGERAVDIA